MNTSPFVPFADYASDVLQSSRYPSPTDRYLGIVDDYEIGGNAQKLYIGRALEPADYERFLKALRFLAEHGAAHQQIEIARRNLLDLQQKVHDAGLKYKLNQMLPWADAREAIIEVNRTTLNFLGSVRAFLDHTESRLKRIYGDDSQQFKVFKEATSKAFDGQFSYRFLSKLRNYSQHCGMPLGSIQAKSTLDSPTGEAEHEFDFYFNRDDLLQKYNEWGKLVEPDLRNMPQHFSLLPHVEAVAACLDEIHWTTIATDEVALKENIKILEDFASEADGVQGEICVLTNLDFATGADGRVRFNVSMNRCPRLQLEDSQRSAAELQGRRETRGLNRQD